MSEILLATVDTSAGSIDGDAALTYAVEAAQHMVDLEPAELFNNWDDGSLIIDTDDSEGYPGMSERIIRYSIEERDRAGFETSVERWLFNTARRHALGNRTITGTVVMVKIDGKASVFPSLKPSLKKWANKRSIDDFLESQGCDFFTFSPDGHDVTVVTADIDRLKAQSSAPEFSRAYENTALGDIYYGKRLVVRDDTEVYYPLKAEVGDARTYEDIADRLKDRPLVWETNPNGHSAWLDVKSCPERENELGTVRDGKILCAALINDDGFVTAKSLSALDELLREKKSLDTMYSALAFLRPVWEVEKEEEYFVVTDTYTERHWAWVDLTDWEAFDQRHTPQWKRQSRH